MLFKGSIGQKPELVNVPNLVGSVYEDLPEYDDFVIKKDDEVHDDKYPAGQIIKQTPEADEKIVKGEAIYVVISKGKIEEPVLMPDILGWELSQAEKSLNALTLNLHMDIEYEFHNEVAKDCIIRTEPAAETVLSVGQNVKLIVSLGVEIKEATMPNLVGTTKDGAVRILESQELDLVIETKPEFSSTADVNEVIRTDPELGTQLKTGQTVVIYYSKGPELANMPNVTGLAVDKAVNILVNSGFKNYVIESVESDAEKDTVVKQSVEKNTEVDVNTEIILEVSMGPGQGVTRNIVIDLRGSADASDCHVKVMVGNNVVFNETVAKGTKTITLENQTYSGTVEYTVMIDDQDGFVQTEEFKQS